MRLSRVLLFRSFGFVASPSRILYLAVSNLRTLSLIFPPPFSFSCSPSLPRLPLSWPPFRSHGLHKAPPSSPGGGDLLRDSPRSSVLNPALQTPHRRRCPSWVLSLHAGLHGRGSQEGGGVCAIPGPGTHSAPLRAEPGQAAGTRRTRPCPWTPAARVGGVSRDGVKQGDNAAGGVRRSEGRDRLRKM